MALQVIQLGLSGSEVTLPTESRTVNQIGYQEFVFEGRAVDGTLHTDRINTKQAWQISFDVCGRVQLAEFQDIYLAQFNNNTDLSLIFGDFGGGSSTYTVRLGPIQWANRSYQDDWYYSGVTLNLQEI